MIQSVQELPLILTTNTSDITFSNDELRTRSATCRGWLNHTEGTSQYTILGSGNCNQPGLFKHHTLWEFAELCGGKTRST